MNKDSIVLLPAFPNELLQLFVSEDDEVDFSLKQLFKVGKIILESPFSPVV
jgi:hypothetical protein